LKEIFILADKKNKGLLNETEILSLLQQLNVTAPARVVKPKFKVGSSNQIRLFFPLSTNHTRLIHPLNQSVDVARILKKLYSLCSFCVGNRGE
jgi:hypothetical protein